MHGIQLVQDLAVILAGAAVATVICQRLKQPVVLGYILAGVVIGPNTPAFRLISNEEEIRTLAELGVILLMFSVGLHFSFRKLKEVGGWLWLRQSWRSRECFFWGNGWVDVSAGVRWRRFFWGRFSPFPRPRLLQRFWKAWVFYGQVLLV